MKYQQPYGVSDVNAPYINGDPSLGRQGSIPPAAAFEYTMREVVSVVSNSGMTPDDADLQQLARAIRRQTLNYFIDTGTANHLIVSPTLPLTQYTSGLPLRVKVKFDNTLASYINAGGLGEVEIIKANGASLIAGEIRAGQVACLVFDGLKFQLQNFLGLSAGSTFNNFYNVDLPYCHDTSVVPNQVIAPFNPVLLSQTDGDFIAVKIANANTGPMVITVNSLPTKAIVHGDSSPCIGKEVAVGQIALLVFDGTAWQFVGAVGGTVGAVIIGAPSGPVLDTSVFNGGGTGSFSSNDQGLFTIVPFSSATPGSGGNVSLVGGNCRVLKAGRYTVQCSGVVTLPFGGFVSSDSGPAMGTGGFIYKNGARQETSPPLQNVTRQAIMDCAVGDNITSGIWIATPLMGGETFDSVIWSNQMWVTRFS